MTMIKMPDGIALTHEMTEALPLYCYADKPIKRLLMKQGVVLEENSRLEITDVHYIGEAGGITCSVERPDGEGALVMSATQIRFSDEGEIYDKINEYREARLQWLRQEELKDKMLGCSGRIKYAKSNKDGSMNYSSDDGTEIITFPRGNNQIGIKPNIPRNSPCPCGSGKKYKKCCGLR